MCSDEVGFWLDGENPEKSTVNISINLEANRK